MSRVTFSSGDKIEECMLGSAVGFYSEKLPIDAEILSVGVRDKRVVFFYVTKSSAYPVKERKFFIQKSNEALPREDFKYYFYVGTVARYGLHLFELTA